MIWVLCTENLLGLYPQTTKINWQHVAQHDAYHKLTDL
jgi:hypothetical protein